MLHALEWKVDRHLRGGGYVKADIDGTDGCRIAASVVLYTHVQ
jgi:hypothetical protein